MTDNETKAPRVTISQSLISKGSTDIEIRRGATPGTWLTDCEDTLLDELEEKLYQWRIDQYGLVKMEVTAKEIREGDIIPGIGMTVGFVYHNKSKKAMVIAEVVPEGQQAPLPHVCLDQHHMLTIHRRVE